MGTQNDINSAPFLHLEFIPKGSIIKTEILHSKQEIVKTIEDGYGERMILLTTDNKFNKAYRDGYEHSKEDTIKTINRNK